MKRTPAEVEILQKLEEQRTEDWIFASDRKQRLCDRSLHHIIQQAVLFPRLQDILQDYWLAPKGWSI